MDSGAATSVALPCVLQQMPMSPSSGSVARQKYPTANGKKLANLELGQKKLHVITYECRSTK